MFVVRTLLMNQLECSSFWQIEGISVFVFERSPRWTSGSPRMLLVLIREFESRGGEILNLLAKIRKKSTTAASA